MTRFSVIGSAGFSANLHVPLPKPTTLSVITIGVETGLFSILAEGNGAPKKVEDLARVLSMQPSFLSIYFPSEQIAYALYLATN